MDCACSAMIDGGGGYSRGQSSMTQKTSLNWSGISTWLIIDDTAYGVQTIKNMATNPGKGTRRKYTCYISNDEYTITTKYHLLRMIV